MGVFVTMVTALICFYFGSFATKSQVDSIASDLTHHKLDVEKNYTKTTELIRVESKIDKIKTALCIMDDRTCDIK